MPKSYGVQENTLLYLRLAATCRNMALDVPDLALKARILRLATVWTEIADEMSTYANASCDANRAAN
jgi:hypothetical protein